MINIRPYIYASITTVLRVGWFPLAVLLADGLLAHPFDLYARWPAIDIPFHFLGGLSIAYFVSGGLKVFSEYKLISRPDALIHIVMVVSMACTAAVLWEFAEWLLDALLGTTCQLGLGDTMLDLFLGVAGGACFGLAVAIATAREYLVTYRTGGGNEYR